MAWAPARWIFPLTLAAITTACYLQTLRFDFVYDDVQQIVQDQPRLQWRALPGYFKTDVWSPISFVRTNYYRPVFLTWLLLNYQLFGLNPALWHAGAVACHAAATLLFYFLARRLTEDPMAAGCAALLFGVHPVHVEGVAWISGATEPLFAVFAFGALVCHLRGRGLWRAAAVALFAGALFEKETAIVLPVLVAAYEWIFGAGAKRLRRAVTAAVPYAAVALVYLGARVLALGNLAPVGNRWPAGGPLRSVPFAIWFYLRQLILPWQYSIFHPIQPVREIGLANFVLPAAAAVGAAAALVWVSRRSKAAAFGALLLVVPLLPVLNLFAFAPYDYVHDRYLYVPSAGFCLLAGLGLSRLKWRRAAAAAVAGALLLVNVAAARAWQDERTLFGRATRAAPENPMALIYWGKTLVHEKRYAEALAPLKQGMFLDLDSLEMPQLLAACYYGLGDLDTAAGYLRDAIRMKPILPDPYLNLAMIEASRGQLAAAEAHIRQALRLRPGPSPLYAGYHLRLAEVLESRGNLKAALAEYEAELAENPEGADVRDRLSALKQRISGVY